MPFFCDANCGNMPGQPLDSPDGSICTHCYASIIVPTPPPAGTHATVETEQSPLCQIGDS